ncbi:MAG: thiamine pyrophosphate-dependent enzyme [Coriobacteriia bacterium]|nr:thiamine pyrophosphate-dependent enzyme [Coriobacteriia bacterium]
MAFLSGNEAIAQGAWEAGVRIGVAYPGTPSTETMEEFSKKPGVYAEWAPNEKVAVEVAMGASAAGARVLATMKHVGVNVAADPLFTASYTGVNGGFMVLCADDPGMFSSQNEQDSRFYAHAAHLPMFEPSNSDEALRFARDAYGLSEQFDTPFLMRTTVRTSHAKTVTEVGERTEVELRPYEKDAAKWVMMPAFAKPRRVILDARDATLREWADTCPYNATEMRDSAMGIVCSGACYQYVRDAMPEASTFKLGLVWPLPQKRLEEFAASVDKLYVIDEASDYLSSHVKALGIDVAPFVNDLPHCGEVSPLAIAHAFGKPLPAHETMPDDVPGRPPALCPGCPHRPVFKELSRMRAIVTGDIGCYTLGGLPPLSGIDSTLDMGASISMAHGFELALAGTEHRPVVGVIGDSTFGHSGLSSLLGTAYNRGTGTICILDNRTTAMTGQQGNPFNGVTLQHRVSREMNIEKIVAALGIEDIQTVNPHDIKAVRAALKSATANDDLSVIVFRAPCVLLDKKNRKPACEITDKCTACGSCIRIGCPALSRDEATGCALIDPDLCIGCGDCAQYCRFDAIRVPVAKGGQNA